ncbi:MAG: phytanoyl-CoA dioxygenase family protein [Novosphingobium sp.]
MSALAQGKQKAVKSEHIHAFERDGLALVKQALSPREMDRIEQVFAERLANPEKSGGTFERMYTTEEGTVINSIGNSVDNPLFTGLIREAAIADIASDVLGGKDIWYQGEQIWLKEGGRTHRTGWHQDTSYLPVMGSGMVVLWIPLDPLPAENVLEIVRGSHKGILYNGSIFDPNDDTVPLYDEADLPRMPDIEANRGAWDIVSYDMQPGDVLAFHPHCLHGGAPTIPGQRRRTISFRFFDGDAEYRPLPKIRKGHANSEDREKINEQNNTRGFGGLEAGEPASNSPLFRQVRPWTAKESDQS